MERNIQKIGLVNWDVLLLAGVIVMGASRYANSSTAEVGTLFIGLGFLVALISAFQVRLIAKQDHTGVVDAHRRTPFFVAPASRDGTIMGASRPSTAGGTNGHRIRLPHL